MKIIAITAIVTTSIFGGEMFAFACKVTIFINDLKHKIVLLLCTKLVSHLMLSSSGSKHFQLVQNTLK